jgi:SPP1 gp7 family putative phage head morphogenesis protein
VAILTLDRKRDRLKNPVRIAPAEHAYRARLRPIADQIGNLVNGFPAGNPSASSTIQELLRRYADALAPWAQSTAAQMLEDLNRRDEQAWMRRAADMSRSLRDEIKNARTGEIMRALLAEQVTLITSIPREAADRVHLLTLEGLADSKRAASISKAIQQSGEVAKSRADTIARTEVSRTAATLTQARAESVSSPGYFWRTSEDSDVRSDHRELDGKFFAWADPPIADRRSGTRAHPGCIWNCRCWAEPVVPD